MKSKHPKNSLVEIGKGDPLLNQGNKCCKTVNGVQKGVYVSGEDVIICPDVYKPQYDFASISFGGLDFLKFLRQQPIHIMTDADEYDGTLPSIGQRLPDDSRAKKILHAWDDSSWVPERKLETIRLFAFNVKVTKRGICFSPDSRLLVIDGGGRLQASLRGLNEIMDDESLSFKDHVIHRRQLVFQINIDLSGDLAKAVQEFLLHNRDAKRTSSGTNLCAENTLLDQLEAEGRLNEAADYDSPNWSAYVLRRLLKEFNHSDSLLPYLPWAFEGKKQDRKLIHGRAGNISSLRTVLAGKSGSQVLQVMRKKYGIKVKDLPALFDFFFTEWRTMLPTACSEMLTGNFNRLTLDSNQKISPRVVTSLGLKTIIMVSLVVYSKSGRNGKKFRELCGETFQEHFRHNGHEYPNKGKKKKMSPDEFWYQNSWFNTASFNSGAQNTRAVVEEFKRCAEAVVR